MNAARTRIGKLALSMFAVLWTGMLSHNPIVAAAQEKSTTSEPRKLSEEKARALALYAPRPPYPELARAQGITGSGVVTVSVDPSSGVVRAARMWVSTGHIFLDDLALSTFRKWRFRPGTMSQVNIPITFSMHSLYVRTSGDRWWLQNVTNWLLPYYPYEALHKGLSGSGVVILKIDTQSGSVASAAMLKSTGHQILDSAALRAFQQWRFKPGTLSTLQIPIEFARVPRPG